MTSRLREGALLTFVIMLLEKIPCLEKVSVHEAICWSNELGSDFDFIPIGIYVYPGDQRIEDVAERTKH